MKGSEGTGDRFGRIPLKVKRLFWDVDREGVDLEVHRPYVIKRIMDYGDMEDVKWMLAIYPAKDITEVVKKSRGLSRKSACFWAAYFNIPKEEIRCLKMS